MCDEEQRKDTNISESFRRNLTKKSETIPIEFLRPLFFPLSVECDVKDCRPEEKNIMDSLPQADYFCQAEKVKNEGLLLAYQTNNHKEEWLLF